MVICCDIFDPNPEAKPTAAIFEVDSVTYNRELEGAVLRCADGFQLVKSVSEDFYLRKLWNPVIVGHSQGATDLRGLGFFVRLEPDESPQLWASLNWSLYKKTRPAWDTEAKPSRGGEGMSHMNMF